MEQQYESAIKEILTLRGALGVNAIKAELAERDLDIPLSTLQKQLMRQTYFIKTEDRKWELPERVLRTRVVKSDEDIRGLIKTQMDGIGASTHLITSYLEQLKTLLPAVTASKPPVAAPSPSIDPKLIELDKRVKEVLKTIEGFYGDMSPETSEFLKNTDFVAFVVDKGREVFNTTIVYDIRSFIFKETDELSETTRELLTPYRKRKK